MKKLTTSIDARNRELHGVYHPSEFVNYHPAPPGNSALEIPEYASYVEISTGDEGAWYAFGGSDVTVLVPTDAIIDGSAPNYLIPNRSRIYRILSETHIAIDSGGPVVLSFWSQ
jgi:hypothetical protein